jgi:hypothetical protein
MRIVLPRTCASNSRRAIGFAAAGVSSPVVKRLAAPNGEVPPWVGFCSVALVIAAENARRTERSPCNALPDNTAHSRISATPMPLNR